MSTPQHEPGSTAMSSARDLPAMLAQVYATCPPRVDTATSKSLFDDFLASSRRYPDTDPPDKYLESFVDFLKGRIEGSLDDLQAFIQEYSTETRGRWRTYCIQKVEDAMNVLEAMDGRDEGDSIVIYPQEDSRTKKVKIVPSTKKQAVDVTKRALTCANEADERVKFVETHGAYSLRLVNVSVGVSVQGAEDDCAAGTLCVRHAPPNARLTGSNRGVTSAPGERRQRDNRAYVLVPARVKAKGAGTSTRKAITDASGLVQRREAVVAVDDEIDELADDDGENDMTGPSSAGKPLIWRWDSRECDNCLIRGDGVECTPAPGSAGVCLSCHKGRQRCTRFGRDSQGEIKARFLSVAIATENGQHAIRMDVPARYRVWVEALCYTLETDPTAPQGQLLDAQALRAKLSAASSKFELTEDGRTPYTNATSRLPRLTRTKSKAVENMALLKAHGPKKNRDRSTGERQGGETSTGSGGVPAQKNSCPTDDEIPRAMDNPESVAPRSRSTSQGPRGQAALAPRTMPLFLPTPTEDRSSVAERTNPTRAASTRPRSDRAQTAGSDLFQLDPEGAFGSLLVDGGEADAGRSRPEVTGTGGAPSNTDGREGMGGGTAQREWDGGVGDVKQAARMMAAQIEYDVAARRAQEMRKSIEVGEGQRSTIGASESDWQALGPAVKQAQLWLVESQMSYLQATEELTTSQLPATEE
ncbi:hypothetical protein LXA43DRAFT_1066490 [Ganoderma leucocontextum]|nr:hypothetical protein LXA43DRAFT_1066490 [Ganoderma leucocontextum]